MRRIGCRGSGSRKAAIALAEEDPDRAVQLFQEGRVLVPKCSFCGLPELGEAFEAASMPDSAVAVRTKPTWKIPALFRSQQDNTRLHRVLWGLGRSYEAMGQPDRAGDYYQWLQDLWSEADVGLQPQVDGLRGKLTSLGRDPE